MRRNRTSGPERVNVGEGFAYEDESAVSQVNWVDINLEIFEHVGLKSGGAESYDPSTSTHPKPTMFAEGG